MTTQQLLGLDLLSTVAGTALLFGAAVLTLIPGLELLTAGIAAVAAGVYFVDVRPRVLEVQGKSR